MRKHKLQLSSKAGNERRHRVYELLSIAGTVLILCCFFYGFTVLAGGSSGTGIKGNEWLIGRWAAKDGIQFVEFFADNRCARSQIDTRVKGGWITVQGTIRLDALGEAFCECEGSSGFYVRRGPNTLALDYGMGGQPELFYRVGARETLTSERFIVHAARGDVAVIDFRKHPALLNLA